jgi:hypothetical protein
LNLMMDIESILSPFCKSWPCHFLAKPLSPSSHNFTSCGQRGHVTFTSHRPSSPSLSASATPPGTCPCPCASRRDTYPVHQDVKTAAVRHLVFLYSNLPSVQVSSHRSGRPAFACLCLCACRRAQRKNRTINTSTSSSQGAPGRPRYPPGLLLALPLRKPRGAALRRLRSSLRESLAAELTKAHRH